MIEAIVFDMEGVLVDARDWHFEALNGALSLFGVEISRADHENLYDGLPTRVKLHSLSEQGLIPYALHSLINGVKQDMTLRIANRDCYPLVSHLIMMAELKRRKFKLGVATNSIRETTEVMLGLSGVLGSFDTVVTNEDVERAKPHPDIYLKACQNLIINPSNVLVVEDNEYGIQAARSAGCQVLEISNPTDLNLEVILNHIDSIEA
jgi:beta-phosphoglucomutase